ncbi:MAG: penicillin acylase family protein [Acidobacteriota bacterium]
MTTYLLRAINLSIAVLLAGLLAAVCWFVWRPLPKTSGEISAPITAKANIVRDAQGVPHITAASWQDAIFLQGYSTAQDRLFQMDSMRRLAAGELAEVIGPSALDLDREARHLRLDRMAEVQDKGLTPDARAVFAAYARGVNYFIETHRKQLPLEFTILQYEPRPWRVRDTILVSLQMHRMLSTSWRGELSKLHMQQSGDAAKVAFLYPARLGDEVAPGSNAWALSGAHTASGKPMLASDPHLEFNEPSPWYMIHLKAPDLDVTGASLVGVPAVIIGHNQHIAWGMTNLEFDLQDLYKENMDAQSGRYQYQNQIEQAHLEGEKIPVKGQKPFDSVNIVTRHGPLVVSDQSGNYVLHWVPNDITTLDFPFLAMNRAGNWDEFNTALQRFSGPAQNFVYADADGNIGYHVAGMVPIRASAKGPCAGDVPTVGSTADCEWRGYIPYADLPQVYNPPSGMIVSANQNPFPEDYKYPVTGVFAPTYRAHQIQDQLKMHEQWKVPEMLALQKDVYSGFLHFLAQQTVKAWDQKPKAKDVPQSAVDVLRNWNGQMEIKQAAPMLASLLYEEMRSSMAAAASKNAGEYTSRMAAPVLERLLRERPSGWFPNYDVWLVDSLAAAVAEGQKVQGSDVSRWDYGQYNRVFIPNPVLGRLPVVGQYIDLGPVSMSGSSTTVKQTTTKLGPSFRMVADLGNLDNSVANITLGQSGQILSWHYWDQWNSYHNGTSYPMQFNKVNASDTLTVNPF